MFGGWVGGSLLSCLWELVGGGSVLFFGSTSVLFFGSTAEISFSPLYGPALAKFEYDPTHLFAAVIVFSPVYRPAIGTFWEYCTTITCQYKLSLCSRKAKLCEIFMVFVQNGRCLPDLGQNMRCAFVDHLQLHFASYIQGCRFISRRHAIYPLSPADHGRGRLGFQFVHASIDPNVYFHKK